MSEHGMESPTGEGNKVESKKKRARVLGSTSGPKGGSRIIPIEI
jgi:hypothetical protein